MLNFACKCTNAPTQINRQPTRLQTTSIQLVSGNPFIYSTTRSGPFSFHPSCIHLSTSHRSISMNFFVDPICTSQKQCMIAWTDAIWHYLCL